MIARPILPISQEARPVLRAAGSIFGTGILVRLIALAREIVVAAVFGRGDAVDAFASASLLPSLLTNLIGESMNQALLPTLVRVETEDGHESAQRLVSNAQFWLVVLLSLAALCFALSAPVVFPLLTSGFAAEKRALAIPLFRWLLPGIVLSGIAANCSAVLNLRGVFALTTLAPALVPVLGILLTLSLGHTCGIPVLVWATLGGTLLQALSMACAMHRRGFRFALHRYPGTPGTNAVVQQFGPLLFSGIVASGGLLADQIMAAMLPSGSLATLVYAGRIPTVLMALLGGTLATALTPHLSTLTARSDWQQCQQTLRQWVLISALISIPTCILLIAGSHTLIRLTLQHGVFHATDTAAVAPVLALYALQIPFYTVSRVYYRFLLALRRSDLILACGVLNLVVDVVLNLLLMRWMGVAGIALSTSLWTLGTFLFLGFWSRRLLRNLNSQVTTENL